MQRWITGWDLLKRWKVNDLFLKQMIHDGDLTSYAPEAIVEVKCFWLGRKIFVVPKVKKDRRKQRIEILEKVGDLFFNLSEIEWIERDDTAPEIEPQSNPAQQERGTEEQRKASNAEQEIEPSKQLEQNFKEENNKIDTFIRSLQVSYVSDSEVRIKDSDKKAKIYTCGEIGFKENSKTWQSFIKVLQSPDHAYHVGIYSADKDPIKNRNYNKLVKRLRNFSEKFVSFLNDIYHVSLPKSLNIFENRRGRDRDGTYKPIFQIVDKSDAIQSTDIKNMSEKEILNKLGTLSEQLKREKDPHKKDELLIEIGDYAEHAKKKEYITEDQLRNMISTPDEEASTEDVLSRAKQWGDINDR